MHLAHQASVNKKPTIHVIDDDDAVRDSIRIMLEIEGFAVCSYPSGAAFLRKAQLDQTACLLVDMHMPGMDGLDLLRQLRREGIHTPAVVMTARASEGLRRALGPVGGVLLEKPFRLWEVIASLRTATGRDDL